MNYHNITKQDMVNGDGLRVVLWVSGCNHFCKGCHNSITWDCNSGLKFTSAETEELYDELKKDYCSGITFSGGDPLFPTNREEITKLAKQIKQDFKDKTIWLYTGFLFDDIKNLDIINFIDVLCDGKFVLEEKNDKKMWVGSNNQRVIDVKKTLKSNKIVLHCE